jgi:hypothetical protein
VKERLGVIASVSALKLVMSIQRIGKNIRNAAPQPRTVTRIVWARLVFMASRDH